MRNVLKCAPNEVTHSCRNAFEGLGEVCTMVIRFVGPRRSIMMVVLDGDAMVRTSATRNEGSDEPALIRIQGIEARAATTTVVIAYGRAPYR